MATTTTTQVIPAGTSSDGTQNYSGANASWNQQQNLNSQYGASLDAQGAALQQGVNTADSNIGTFDKGTAQGLDAIQGQSARASANGQGLYGGGRGLSMLRSAALQRGQAEGQFNSQQAQARNALSVAANQARMQQAQGNTEIIGEKQKILQQQAARQGHMNTALDSARGIADSIAKNQWFTVNDTDKANMVKRIRSEVLSNETDPQTIQAVEEFISQIQNGTYNAPGKIDT